MGVQAFSFENICCMNEKPDLVFKRSNPAEAMRRDMNVNVTL